MSGKDDREVREEIVSVIKKYISRIEETTNNEDVIVVGDDSDYTFDVNDLTEISDFEKLYLEAQKIVSDEKDYLSDDEDFLEHELDEEIKSDDDFAIFQQLENVISWQLKNFYTDEGKPKSRLQMKNEPPIFEISDNDGNYADFIVTKNLAQSLAQAFNDVNYAYYGVDNRRNRNKSSKKDTDFFGKVLDYISRKPVHSVLIVLVVVFFILSFF